MKDKLDIIFEMQKKLNDDIKKRREIPQYTREEWMQKETLAMLSELSEVLDEVNFKWWKNPKPVEEAAIKGELVDILHFFISMCLIYDMSAKELFDLYLDKNSENFHRQNGLTDKQGYDVSLAK